MVGERGPPGPAGPPGLAGAPGEAGREVRGLTRFVNDALISTVLKNDCLSIQLMSKHY